MGVIMRKSLILLISLLTLIPAVSFAADKVVVFAAASTTNMIDEVLAVYNKKGGNASGSYASSGALVKQIQSGAPAGIFISANQEWMDKLEKEGALEKGTRQNLVGNKLVLITNKKNNIKVDFSKKVDFTSILKSEKLVIGAPESVPAGQYAKQSFTKLGYWDSLQKNIVTAANVRDALAFVSRGEALLGVVFGTDAIADKNVTVAAEFPSNTHDDISYPVAVIKDNSNQEVKKLYNFLISDEAKKIYEKYGFKVY